ncbi:hypothetical protein GGE68_001396 [Rhizobium leguminosarum]|uniref:hypothetical protein n=1 Tax=Rhizobium leguminosarum TaxID=384 RepID=UPI0016184E67|nr:hypothetical protein [Rhizobium leguminosarum]MBB5663220.1 hypothetical protein [Rhizobium leguminosarum]
MNRDQFLLDAYEEKLTAANVALSEAKRHKAYYERAIADLKRDQAPDYRGQPPAIDRTAQFR